MISGLSERLRDLRIKRGLSQKQLADRLGISPSIVSSYENNERTPSSERLLALANFYGCSCDFLVGKTSEKPPVQIDVEGLTEEQIQALANIARLMKKA